MFTGIIEEIGKIKSFKKDSNGATIEVECSLVLQDTKLGDSIAINGVCQTVIELSSNSFKARVSDETLKVTTFENMFAECRALKSLNVSNFNTSSAKNMR